MNKKLIGAIATLAFVTLPLTVSAQQHQHAQQAETTTKKHATETTRSDMMKMDHSGMMDQMDHAGMMGQMDHDGMMGSLVERSAMDVFTLPAVIDRLDLTNAQSAKIVQLSGRIAPLVEHGPGTLASLGDAPSTEAVREYFTGQALLRTEIYAAARSMMDTLTPDQRERYASIDMNELHSAVMAGTGHMTMMSLMGQLGCGPMPMGSMPMMQSRSDSKDDAMQGHMMHKNND